MLDAEGETILGQWNGASIEPFVDELAEGYEVRGGGEGQPGSRHGRGPLGAGAGATLRQGARTGGRERGAGDRGTGGATVTPM